jgi:hypothetical protein
MYDVIVLVFFSSDYEHMENGIVLKKTTVFVQGLAPLNSALNPFIYGVFSTRICRQLR